LEETIMPSFAEAIKRDIDKIRFAAEQVKAAPKKKAKKVKSPATDMALKSKNVNVLLRKAAVDLKQVQMKYKKDTTGEVKSYRVAPYSYRFRMSNKRRKRMLFAYDMDDKHIKGFVMRNILKVEILEKKFKPKWPVEIAMWFVAILPVLWG
jgi:predicted DNA-binding transcriptional regulator YafY